MSDKIERQVHFVLAQAHDTEESEDNNTFQYNRAPDGYLFELHSIQVETNEAGRDGTLAIYDGHEFTNWNIWPGVQSMETLARFETNLYQYNAYAPLNGWECKEYTVGARSTSVGSSYKTMAIVWYHLKKASRLELLEYAVKHPRNQDMFRYALRGTTIEPTED